MKSHSDLTAALSGKRFPLEDEKVTQAAIAKALADAGIRFEREVPVDGGVIDFVATFSEPFPPPCRGRRFRHIGLEVKIKGQAAAILRQMRRYAAEDGLDGLVLMTARPVSVPAAIGGKPASCIDMSRAWL